MMTMRYALSQLSHWVTPRRLFFLCMALAFAKLLHLFVQENVQRLIERADGTVDLRRQTVESLVELTNAYASNTATSTVGVVLASIHTDKLDWLLDYCKQTGSTPFLYTGERPPEAGLLVAPTLRGRESPAYLSYIVDFYDHLPDYSLFVHAWPEQWHNDLFGDLTIDTLKLLRFESVDARGYVNLRCEHNPGCPAGVWPLTPSEADIEKDDIRAHFALAYEQMFNVTREQVPGELGNICCGQFAVSRERIRARPKEDYERILEWAATTNLTDGFGVGWVLEKLWHVIFGMDPVYCPRYEQCRCDNYGWCGPLPSGETFQAVTKQSR